MHTGIILRHEAPKRNLCALLDNRVGRINFFYEQEYLSAGTVLQYRLVTAPRYRLEHPEQVHVPLHIARTEMLFLHYLLEMCYHFLPEGTGITPLYDLLLFVLEQRDFSLEKKKIILTLLLVHLELYPEDNPYTAAYLHELTELPLAQALEHKINPKVEKNIAGWLYQSVRIHMPMQNFKTIHFLDEI